MQRRNNYHVTPTPVFSTKNLLEVSRDLEFWRNHVKSCETPDPRHLEEIWRLENIFRTMDGERQKPLHWRYL